MAKASAAVAAYQALGLSGAAVDPDVALMMALKSGDQSAFAHLVARHQARVVALIYRFVGNEAEAEDLAQEVFLRVFRTRDRYEPRARFSTWLYRIASNVSLNSLRSRSRRHTVSMPLAGEGQDSHEGQTATQIEDLRLPRPAAQLEGDELRAQVRLAIDQLPENQKVAVILNKYENMNYDDIGATMGCSPLAVKSLLARARINLRQRLEHYVHTGNLRQAIS